MARKPANLIAIYGNDCPAELWLFDGGLLASPRIQPYQRHRLDLPDILQVAGYQVDAARPPLRLWPSTTLPAVLAAQQYGRDKSFTRQLHEDHHRWSSWDADDCQGLPRYELVRRVLPKERIAHWKKSVWQIHRAMIRRRWGWPKPHEVDVDVWSACGNENQWTSLYSQAKNLGREAARRLSMEEEDIAMPSTRLGPCLEQAVARRIWQWLTQSPESEVVQSLWINVIVQAIGASSAPAGEFDVLFALKNGILIHVECKAVAASRKDLQARLQNLQSAGSRLAQMAVCSPLFTEYADQPWFLPMHTLRTKIANSASFPVLPFTLPGQSSQYELRDTSGVISQHTCPPFEQALGALLQPYHGGRKCQVST
jgi:hypothetical protein